MLRYERIGVDSHWVQRVLPLDLEQVEKFPPEQFPASEYGGNLGDYVQSTGNIVIGYYLLDKAAEARAWVVRLVAEAKKYFFGEWRLSMPDNPARPEDNGYWARGGGPWIRVYRYAAAFAAAVSDWDSVRPRKRVRCDCIGPPTPVG